MNLRATAALLFALSNPQLSEACSIAILDREIYFPERVDALNSEQVRSIANWYIELRDGRLGVADVMVYANSIEGDTAHASLVKARVRSIVELVKTLVGSDTIPLTTRITPHVLSEVQQFPEVVISVQPRCASTNSCCGTDPDRR